jgi:hypothetical protein
MKFSIFNSYSSRKSAAYLGAVVFPLFFLQEQSRTSPKSSCAGASSGDAPTAAALGMSAAQKEQFEQIKHSMQADVRKKVDLLTPDENAEWERQKSTCSFCQYFLASPCAVPFRRWSMCVDIAKEESLDYVSTCSPYTTALMQCTEAESKYFEAPRAVPDQATATEAGSGTAVAGAEAGTTD